MIYLIWYYNYVIHKDCLYSVVYDDIEEAKRIAKEVEHSRIVEWFPAYEDCSEFMPGARYDREGKYLYGESRK